MPNTCLVAGDVMLAQKIALETDELAALAVAKHNFLPLNATRSRITKFATAPVRSIALCRFEDAASRRPARRRRAPVRWDWHLR
jgi:hypothetical protein